MKTNTIHPILGNFLNGRYQTIQIESASLFSDIYVAEDSWNDDLLCVIKHLKPKLGQPERTLITKRQFASEVLILNQLGSHHQIPQLLDCFENEQGFYLVQELIVGELLSKQLTSRNPWTQEQCVEFLDDVLGILEFIHRQGFVHGNLQPNNLIQREADGRFVLLDFALASQPSLQVKPRVVPIKDAIAPLAIPAVGYTPAEQLAGQIFPSSDIYALGMMAIEALTGLNPTELPTEPETGEVIWQQQVSVSEGLLCLLNNMVRYEFKNRYQSAIAVRTQLNQLYDRCEENGVSESSKELQDCLHAVPRSKVATSELSSKVTDVPLTKGDYARQIAIACIPKVPPLLSGIGAGMFSTNAVAISLGLYTLLYAKASHPGLDLLEQASQQYKLGNLEGAIAIANQIPIESSVYLDAALAKRQWRQEWNTAATQFDVIETAFNEQRWQDVLDAAQETPDLVYWQQKIAPFVDAAKPELEVEAQQLLQEAYQRAAEKDFTGALLLIKQISTDTPTGAQIQPKLFEYSQKQQIKAQSFLQKAYQSAIEKDFQEALQYLAEIPEGTPAYDTAQIKMVEYSQKQNLLEQAQMQAVLNSGFTQIVVKPTQLGNEQTQKEAANLNSDKAQTKQPSKNLNPGNAIQEVTPKPVRSLAAVP